MNYDVIVVGGGVSGLTAAAFLAKEDHTVLLLEKEDHCGGLVGSFKRDGFTFDAGIRALEDAGVLFPMLKRLGIEIEFVKNHVTVGIEDQFFDLESDESVEEYRELLKGLYPESSDEIAEIIADIRKIMRYMDIQYGIDNPLFLDVREDLDYFMREVFPWMFRFALTAPKVAAKNEPVESYLRRFTNNQALIDIISQHFFTETPAYFALSYFKLYQDYYYPKQGTGALVDALVDYIEAHGGEIRTDAMVDKVDPAQKLVHTAAGESYGYNQLVWAADQKALYHLLDSGDLQNQRVSKRIADREALIADMTGNDSVLTLYLQVDLPPSYFSEIAAGHFFYTPSRKGISAAGEADVTGTWEKLREWLEQFFALTTYEIAIPALREASLAPEGKTGLIISTLFDYQISKAIADNGWYDDFKAYVTQAFCEDLENSVYPGLTASVESHFIATPLTLQKITGNTDGAITGWSFTNQPMPAESRLTRIANAVQTPIPDVVQAGQWTYSPSGLPVSLITGKLAADAVAKQLQKQK
ncbi:NAD(P)/FAD-dependent oxidoreductase [bacterium]|nr:NAD(P)/FAD-dependent oxidoreductase [bacterium]